MIPMLCVCLVWGSLNFCPEAEKPLAAPFYLGRANQRNQREGERSPAPTRMKCREVKFPSACPLPSPESNAFHPVQSQLTFLLLPYSIYRLFIIFNEIKLLLARDKVSCPGPSSSALFSADTFPNSSSSVTSRPVPSGSMDHKARNSRCTVCPLAFSWASCWKVTHTPRGSSCLFILMEMKHNTS